MGYGDIRNRSDFTQALDKTEDSSSIMVIYSSTSWCPNCKAVEPKIDELTQEFGDEKHVLWYKMNIEEAEGVAQEYGVSAVPTFMLFKDGDMLPEETVTGPHHKRVRAMVEKNLPGK